MKSLLTPIIAKHYTKISKVLILVNKLLNYIYYPSLPIFSKANLKNVPLSPRIINNLEALKNRPANKIDYQFRDIKVQDEIYNEYRKRYPYYGIAPIGTLIPC